MSYRKFQVDNIVCSRRFHITFDDQQTPVAKTEVSCQVCGLTIFTATNHPPVKLARDENLVQTGTLSDLLVRECKMTDEFSATTRNEPKKLIYGTPAKND